MKLAAPARLAFSLALGLVLTVTSPAFALSCLPVTVPDAYHKAAEAEEVYVILHGKLQFDAGKLPVTDWNNQQDTPPETHIQAWFQGKGLSHKGFSHSYDRIPVSLRVQCFGPWCASIQPQTDQLLFVQKDGGSYQLTVGPCGGNAFGEPSKKMLNQVKRCMRGGSCPRSGS